MGKPKRAGLHSIDQSWLKYRNCDICGRPFCVNNYADRRVRVPRYRGRIICSFCRYGIGKRLVQLEQIVEQAADLGCLKRFIRKKLGLKKGASCGKCICCKAAELVER